MHQFLEIRNSWTDNRALRRYPQYEHRLTPCPKLVQDTQFNPVVGSRRLEDARPNRRVRTHYQYIAGPSERIALSKPLS